jgi:multidrug efflux pump subunit AcrA (membrane-fusion protein)
MEEHELIELRSDDVQEILGTPPNWLVRWGTTVMVGIIILLLLLAYFIKYPDIISAPVVITTSDPPTPIISRMDGNLTKLLVLEKQEVNVGDVLAVIQSTAKYEDVVKADDIVNQLQNSAIEALNATKLDKGLLLGELQTEYNALLQAIDIYTFTQSNRFDKVNASQLQGQIAKVQRDYDIISRKLRAVKEEKLPAAKRFEAQQKKLFVEGIVSKNDLEAANARIYEVNEEIKTFESLLVNKELEIGTLKNQIVQIQQGANLGNTDQIIKVKEAIAACRAAIDRWKQSFLLTAPVKGVVSFYGKFWKEQQFVKQGEEVLVIVPSAAASMQQKIVGKALLPIVGAGKVKKGQRVVIFLESYPYEEFGTVDALVTDLATIPKDNTYRVEIEIPGQKVITNYKKEIPQAQQLLGTAQVITEEKRFLQRIMDKVWGITKKY